MQHRLDEIDQSIALYLERIASADRQDGKASKAKTHVPPHADSERLKGLCKVLTTIK